MAIISARWCSWDGSPASSLALKYIPGLGSLFDDDDVAAASALSALSALICGRGRLIEEVSIGTTFGGLAGVGRPNIAVYNLRKRDAAAAAVRAASERRDCVIPSICVSVSGPASRICRWLYGLLF
jgi:hypothetical protein